MIRLAPFHVDIYVELDGDCLSITVKDREINLILDAPHMALLASAMLMNANAIDPESEGVDDDETN